MRTSRRTALQSLAAASMLLQAKDSPPPNLRFVLSDDHTAGSGAYGAKWMCTPNLDRFAREGLLFERDSLPRRSAFRRGRPS